MVRHLFCRSPRHELDAKYFFLNGFPTTIRDGNNDIMGGCVTTTHPTAPMAPEPTTCTCSLLHCHGFCMPYITLSSGLHMRFSGKLEQPLDNCCSRPVMFPLQPSPDRNWTILQIPLFIRVLCQIYRWITRVEGMHLSVIVFERFKKVLRLLLITGRVGVGVKEEILTSVGNLSHSLASIQQ